MDEDSLIFNHDICKLCRGAQAKSRSREEAVEMIHIA